MKWFAGVFSLGLIFAALCTFVSAWRAVAKIDELAPIEEIRGTRLDAGVEGSRRRGRGADSTNREDESLDRRSSEVGSESLDEGDSKSLVELRPDGTHAIDLKVLMFADYDPPELRDDKEELSISAFPERLRGLDGKKIEARGHIIALDFDAGSISRFLLTRFPPGCCFGAMPVLDEWIEVTVPSGREQEFSPYAILKVVGTFSAGEKLDEKGFAESLYRMVGEEIEEVR